MRIWIPASIAIAAASAALVTVGLHAQTQQPYSGSGDYQAYCSSCHGVEAKGDGSIAKSLKKKPADLTQLAKHNNGVFPQEKVYKTVDGRQGSAHSDSDMPAWGEVFAKSSESPGAENAAARINVLVEYLQTVQVK
jgi:mono/diheme cytochrome c family protein